MKRLFIDMDGTLAESRTVFLPLTLMMQTGYLYTEEPEKQHRKDGTVNRS